MTDINNVADSAIRGLEKKTLGGVSRESAESGINSVREEANSEIKTLGDTVASQSAQILGLSDDVKKAQEALRQANADSAYKQEQLQSEIDEVKGKLKDSKQTKVGKEKVLPNGNIQITKVNKNGTTEVLERTPEGKNVSAKFRTIDGDIVKYYFNPVTEDVIKIYKNIDGKETLSVKKDGKWGASEVNVKSEKPEKPTVVSTEKIKDGDGVLHRISYSDGSYENVKTISNGNRLNADKYNSQGKLVEKSKYVYNSEYPYSLRFIETSKFDPETSNLVNRILDYSNGDKCIKEFNDDGIVIKGTYKRNGIITEVKASLNEFGEIINSDYAKETTHTYPKESKIKKAKTEFNGSFTPTKDIMTLKDGSTAIAEINGDYLVYDLTIIDKNKQEKKLEKNEIDSYLEDIGYVSYHDRCYNGYFKNNNV